MSEWSGGSEWSGVSRVSECVSVSEWSEWSENDCGVNLNIPSTLTQLCLRVLQLLLQ